MSKKYTIRNWPEYNKGLEERGNLEIWISEELIGEWKQGPRMEKRKRGGQLKYTDGVIECCLIVRELYGLALRQTVGLMKSLLRKMGLAHLRVPDYTTLCVRQKGLKVEIAVGAKRAGKIILALDSTGLKVYGEGEWKVRQHGASKRRDWLKLHLGTDTESLEIVEVELTDNSVHDGEEGPGLLEKSAEVVDIEACCGDGAYDQRNMYRKLDELGIQARIPPRKGARIWNHGNIKAKPHPRDENLRAIRRYGRKQWKKQIGYHRRSKAEVNMYRIKQTFGDGVKNRLFSSQKTEVTIRCKILNRFTQLGMPNTQVLLA